MRRRALELADIFRSAEQEFFVEYGSSLSVQQRRVFGAIRVCRTAELGGHVDSCLDCGHTRIAYNSCRNRHCPKCQATCRAKWMEARQQELLPVPYFHVVFTLPRELGRLALQNQRVVYGLLMTCAAETLKEVAASPQHLEAKIGGLMVLHTWGQNLMHHPHAHCVVPSGGLSPDGRRWNASRKNFFLPVRVLSRVFRGKFIQRLKQAFARGALQFFGELSDFAEGGCFANMLNRVVRNDWVVYAKRPFGGPEQVLKYLARYTHRVAISNSRLLHYDDNAGEVSFRWKNYAAGNTQPTMTLPATEFIRRFLMHTLPAGFHRIRHFGIFANRHRAENIQRCRELIAEQQPPAQPQTLLCPKDKIEEAEPQPTGCCDNCGSHRIVVIEISPQPAGLRIGRPYFLQRTTALHDTS